MQGEDDPPGFGWDACALTVWLRVGSRDILAPETSQLVSGVSESAGVQGSQENCPHPPGPPQTEPNLQMGSLAPKRSVGKAGNRAAGIWKLFLEATPAGLGLWPQSPRPVPSVETCVVVVNICETQGGEIHMAPGPPGGGQSTLVPTSFVAGLLPYSMLAAPPRTLLTSKFIYSPCFKDCWIPISNWPLSQGLGLCAFRELYSRRKQILSK